jgi:hypothetical protein
MKKSNIKKKILLSSIKLVPKITKNKLVARAISAIINPSDMKRLNGVVLSITLSDINEKWTMSFCDNKVHPEKSLVPNVVVSTTLKNLSTIASKANMIISFEKNSITIDGEENKREMFIDLLYNISDEKLSNLIIKIYSKLRIINLLPARFDFNSITINDITTDTDVNYLRNQAISLEQENLPLAEKLMSLAHQARPDGPVIKQKLDEYRQRLAEAK